MLAIKTSVLTLSLHQADDCPTETTRSASLFDTALAHYNRSLTSQGILRSRRESLEVGLVLNMHSTMNDTHHASHKKTMAIFFFHLELDRFGRVVLVQFKAASFQDVTPGTVKQQVEQRFRELVANDQTLPRVVVVAPSMGNPPGEIIAVELIGKSTRELIWVAEPSTDIG